MTPLPPWAVVGSILGILVVLLTGAIRFGATLERQRRTEGDLVDLLTAVRKLAESVAGIAAFEARMDALRDDLAELKTIFARGADTALGEVESLRAELKGIAEQVRLVERHQDRRSGPSGGHAAADPRKPRGPG